MKIALVGERSWLSTWQDRTFNPEFQALTAALTSWDGSLANPRWQAASVFCEDNTCAIISLAGSNCRRVLDAVLPADCCKHMLLLIFQGQS